jgi:uncharacterized membrane protein YphA (DoxX/SURF4 family)
VSHVTSYVTNLTNLKTLLASSPVPIRSRGGWRAADATLGVLHLCRQGEPIRCGSPCSKGVSLRDANAGSVMYIRIFLQATVGFVFLVSALIKVVHPKAFQRALTNYRVGASLGDAFSDVAVVLIPTAEIIAGLLLVTGLVSFWIGAVIALSLLTIFTAFVFDNARRGVHVDCGCGIKGGRTGYPLVWRNIVLWSFLIVELIFDSSFTILHHHIPAGTLVPLYIESAMAAAACLYVPIIFQEVRHQLGHVG